MRAIHRKVCQLIPRVARKILWNCSRPVGNTRRRWMTCTGFQSVVYRTRPDVNSAVGSTLMQALVQPVTTDVFPDGGLVKMRFGGLASEEGETELDRWMICQHSLCPTSRSNISVQCLSPVTPSKSNSHLCNMPHIEKHSFGNKCEKNVNMKFLMLLNLPSFYKKEWADCVTTFFNVLLLTRLWS